VRFVAEVSVFQPDAETLAKWGGSFFDIFPPDLYMQTGVSPDDENYAPFYSSLNAYVDDNAEYSYTTSTGAEVENAFLLGRIADRLVVVTVRYTVNPLDDNGDPMWKPPAGLAIEGDSLNAVLAPVDERKRDDVIAIWQYCREKWAQR
jgi:hypothetical protein